MKEPLLHSIYTRINQEKLEDKSHFWIVLREERICKCLIHKCEFDSTRESCPYCVGECEEQIEEKDWLKEKIQLKKEEEH